MVEAERAVIGIMLLKPELAPKAIETLLPKMFEVGVLGQAYAAIRKLVKEKREVDAITVLDEILKIPNTSEEETKRLLAVCAETVPSINGYDDYIQSVIDDWRRRNLTEMCARLSLSGMTADEMVVELGEALKTEERIMLHQAKKTGKSFADAQVKFLQWMSKPDDSIKTSWSRFNALTGGIVRKGVTAIMARPGGGKTTFAIQLATCASKSIPVLYQTMEMPQEQIMTAIYSRACCIDSKKIRSKELESKDWNEIATIGELLRQQYNLVIDDTEEVTLTSLEANIRLYKPQLVVVDHLGLLTPQRAKQKRNDELAELTRGLKLMAKQYDIAIIQLVQASRDGDRRKMVMGDAFGSATIEHDCDTMIAINIDAEQADEAVTSTTVSVIKNRHGGVGDIPFFWTKPIHRFSEVAQ